MHRMATSARDGPFPALRPLEEVPPRSPQAEREDDSRETRAGIDALEERRLLAAYRTRGDLAARNRLIGALLPLADLVARRYRYGVETHEDLVQVASLGAMKAVDRFDLERSTTLASYAIPMMAGEIRHHLRDNVAPVHIPRRLHARASNLATVAGEMSSRLGHEPSTDEVGRAAGLDDGEVAEALQASMAVAHRSLEGFAKNDHGENLSYLEVIGAEDRHYDAVEIRAVLADVWRSFDVRTRASLYLRFVEDRTFPEIAARLEISPTHAARLIGRGRARLRFVARLRDLAPHIGA
jgi:RNA polymerase sigma-B factor